jgi:hypothetical protein
MSFKNYVAQNQVGRHHKHAPRQKCEIIQVQRSSFGILSFIITIIIIQADRLRLGYLMLGISAKRSKSSNSFLHHWTFALFASSSLGLLISKLSLLRVGLSGLSRVIHWYIGQDWCLATASLLSLFVSRFGLSALGIEREEWSRIRLVNAFSAQP